MNNDHQPTNAQPAPVTDHRDLEEDVFVEYVSVPRPTWRQRRQDRRQARRDWFDEKKHAWVTHTIEAPLPDRIGDRLPGWARTVKGRVLLGVAAVVVILGWGVVAVAVIS